MEVTALVTAWKDIDASQEASVVINGTHAYVLSVIILFPMVIFVRLVLLRIYYEWNRK